MPGERNGWRDFFQKYGAWAAIAFTSVFFVTTITVAVMARDVKQNSHDLESQDAAVREVPLIKKDIEIIQGTVKRIDDENRAFQKEQRGVNEEILRRLPRR